MFTAKDLITDNNVVRMYKEGKYICFKLKPISGNNMLGADVTVKLNPNEERDTENKGAENVGHTG